jgi:Tfp pilus assembly protein PilV
MKNITGMSMDESGISLVEIVVSMFLLALLAISFLPLIIQSLTLTSTNTTRATATQLVSADLESARLQTPTCASLTTFAATAVATTTDRRGIVLQPRRAVTCPAAGAAGTAIFTSSVTRGTTLTVISKATTLIYVTG